MRILHGTDSSLPHVGGRAVGRFRAMHPTRREGPESGRVEVCHRALRGQRSHGRS